MKKLNKISVIEFCMTIYVMYFLTMYVDNTFHHLFCFNRVDIEILTL